MVNYVPDLMWGQDLEKIFLTIMVPPVAKNNAKLHIESDKLSLKSGSYSQEIKLLYGIEIERSHQKDYASKIVATLAKCECRVWPALTTDTHHSNIKVDWDRWIEDDEATDSSVHEDLATQSAADHPLMRSNNNHKDLDHAPKLSPHDTSNWTSFFTAEMTCAQRMFTMVGIWNGSNTQERSEYVKILVSLVDQKVSDAIKGGEESLRILDEEFYNGVSRPRIWMTEIESLSSSEKCSIISQMYGLLVDEERQLVFKTLI
eukprot:Filipodium_phascolosomae@DN5629_c0_g1_i1.p1